MVNAIAWQKLKKKGTKLNERNEADFYPTNIEHVREAFAQLPSDFQPKTIIDPCAGDGIYGQIAKETYPNSTRYGCDIRNVGASLSTYNGGFYYGNFLLLEDSHLGGTHKFDLVISNPPYSHAEAFVRHSIALLSEGGWLSFLLRGSFAEGQNRYMLFKELPPKIIVNCSDRPSFLESGDGDPHHYAFFMWQKGHTGDTITRWAMADKKKLAKLPLNQKALL